jgi:hypothetical protein
VLWRNGSFGTQSERGARYLDYCSEMLSLISKIGFLYMQNYHDPVATEAVNDLDDLTNGLSRKIETVATKQSIFEVS